MKFDSPAGLSKDGQYQRVEESDGQNEKSCSSEEDRSNLQMFAEAKRRQGRKLWAGFIICLTAVLLTSSAASIYYARHTSSSELMHCGSSPEEAEELGCKFDLMTYGWIHPNCYNASLSAEWQAEWGPWEWRSEKNGTKETEIPPEALPYQRVVYGSQGYHELHCLYSFKLVHLAGLNGYLLSSEAGPISHTDHCIMTIAKPQTLDLESINTRIRNLYTQCVKLRTHATGMLGFAPPCMISPTEHQVSFGLIGASIVASMEQFNASFMTRYCEFAFESKDGGPGFFLDAVTNVCGIRAVDWVEKIDGFMEVLVRSLNDQFPNGGLFSGRLAWQRLQLALATMLSRASSIECRTCLTGFTEKIAIIVDSMRAFLQEYARHRIEYVPKYPITGPHAPLVPGIPVLARAPEMPRVGRAVGLPVLPTSSPFTYYAASMWAQDRILDARDDEIVVEGVEKAVLLEEMFVACI